jgi:RNA polymerase sigma-70 factor (ECF subfamily)
VAERSSTCWTEVRAAVAGDAAARDQFARRYLPVVRAYLATRWRGTPLQDRVDDAVQEAFVACLRPGGALDRLDPARPGGFRPYLYGVLRHVALHVEAGHTREPPRADIPDLDRLPADGPDLSRVFDRAWARAMVSEAAELQARWAGGEGPARRRVELLKLRFYDGLPIRDIARRWGADPAGLHREYAKAREEFREALRAVVAFHRPGTVEEVDRACGELLAALS